MNSRMLLTASVSALAAVALVAPSAHAQDAEGIEGGGSSGSLAGVGSASTGSDDGSLAGLALEDDGAMCELPGLGGSVAKFYPLFGDGEVPPVVMDFVTTTLDSFPNVLDLVMGAGNGAAVLGQTGSLAEGLCTTIFGGEMVLPPVTVIVDEDGNPTTTTTGTAAPDVPAPTSVGSGTSGDASAAGSSGSLKGESVSPLPTSVPATEADAAEADDPGGDAVEN